MRRRHSRWRLACAFVVATAPSLAGTACAEEDGIEALVAYLDGLSSLSAEFTQQRYDEYGVLLETARGWCDIERPGRFRWLYVDPYAQTIVSDGESLWIYDQDLEQVTVSPLDSAARGSPAELLGAELAVRDRYAIARLPDAGDYRWFRLTPLAPASEFQAVDLGMRADEIGAMRLADNLGQTTTLEFSGVRRNADVDDALFEFSVPPGVDLIEGAAPDGDSE